MLQLHLNFYGCLVILLTSSWLVTVQGQYDDVRCKCVCPSVFKPNSTVPSRKVIVRFYSDPSLCKCENMIEDWIQKSNVHFCDTCDCQWQRRNTATIKVVVLFIICVVTLLVLYMLFLMCLDPLLTHRSKNNYSEQQNEEVAMHDVREGGVGAWQRAGISSVSADISVRSSPGVISRVKREVRRVRGQALRWQGTVQEQRKNIYERRAMLN